MTNKNYKVGIKTSRDPDWLFNGLVFASDQDADAYRVELFSRWTSLVESKIFETEEPANVKLDNNKLVFLENLDIKIPIKEEEE